jgi:hypothetical protein
LIAIAQVAGSLAEMKLSGERPCPEYAKGSSAKDGRSHPTPWQSVAFQSSHLIAYGKWHFTEQIYRPLLQKQQRDVSNML